MSRNFLDFVANRKKAAEHKYAITEAFKNADMDKAVELIDKLLSKHIKGLIPLVGFVDTVVDGKECTSKQYLVCSDKKYGQTSFFQLNWINSGNSSEVYSIDFFKDMNVYWTGEGKSTLSLYTLGSNVARLLPIIWNVVNTGNYKLSEEDAKKLASGIKDEVKESKYVVDDLFTFIIYRGLSNKIIEESFLIESEASDMRRAKANEIANAKRMGADSSLIKELEEEYNKIADAVNNGAKTKDDVRLALSTGKSVKIIVDEETTMMEKQANGGRKEPDQVFKEMTKYINLVIKGLQPSLILCGAPGVGKTYKVKKQLKEGGFSEGHNLFTIKGKCTARRLYLALYEFKETKKIVLIDDADSLVGPHADENCINILKAALDSTGDDEGRLVAYGISGQLVDDDGNEVPKRFYYNGGCIIITNYKAGALDTALRGRSFIQDIDFTNEDILKIVKKLLPDIEPDKFSARAKLKAYKYLVELNEKGSDMELSIRTFSLCAKIFEASDGDSDFTEEDARSMIEEQMRLQYQKANSRAKY